MQGRAVARLQGTYYVAGGIWPVVHQRSFVALTGEKRERWLMQSYGILLAGVGVALLAMSDGRARRTLGIAAATSIALPDLWFGLVRRRIPWPYVADGLAELAIAAAWAATSPE